MSIGRVDLARWRAGCCRAGLTVFGIFLEAAGLRRRAGGVLLERPQPRSGEDERAGRRRAAAHHRERGRIPFVLVMGVVGVPRRMAGGVVSQAPIRRLVM